MMINRKNCSLIALLVLVVLPRSSKSIFPRLAKRSTDDGGCEESTAKFCSQIINNGSGLIQRFGPETSHQIQNHYKNATTNCKVLLCVMAMYAVIVEGEKYFPDSPFINDEAFVDVIKGSSLVECNDNKNNYNASRSEDVHTATITTTTTIDDKSYTTDGSGSITDFNQFETASTQQDTQSIKSNEIDGSVNESKHEPRKGIIDILYTNENYTNAAKSQYVNEQTTVTELFGNNHEMGTESVVNLDNLETSTSAAKPQFIYNYGDDERSELDVANKIGTTTDANENTVSTADDFVFVTSFATSTPFPIITTDTDVEDIATNSESDVSNSGAVSSDETKRVLTLETSAMPSTNQSALSQVGNVIFQLLGEEGYNSFSCNLTTATGDDHPPSYFDGPSMYRRTNKLSKRNETTNATNDNQEFQPVGSVPLLQIPESLRTDKDIRLLLLEFNIFELCNFTSNDNENRNEIISKQLALCSNGISKLRARVNGETKRTVDEYSQDIHEAMKKFRVIHASKMKIIKIINLTDYLSSTITESEIPSDRRSDFLELKQFLLVELKNEDLSSFHPDSNRKDVFMVQLFDYLMQSAIVDNKKKRLLAMFKKFIRNVS